MSDDFRLLLNAVAIQRPARFDGVTVAAEWMPAQDEVHAPLILPNVDQLVDQMPLPADRIAGEAVAIGLPLRMKMDGTLRRHRHLARLKRPPFPPVETDGIQINCVSEYAAR